VAAKLRRYLSPATRDYVVSSGGFQGDDGIASKVVLALGMKRGSCPVYPEFGSRLHLVRKADERGRREAESYAREALAHLAGEVTELSVTATISTLRPGAIELDVSYRLGDVPQRVPYTQRVG
jgi:phage gp46-like protein